MTKEEILNGMSEEEFYDMYPDQESWENTQQMKLGGLSGAPHNGQPTARQFFNYGSHVNDGLNIPMSNPFYLAHGGTYYGGPTRPYDMGGNTASPMNYGAFSIPMQYGGYEQEYGGVIDPGNNQDYPILEQGGKAALMSIIKAHSKKMKNAYKNGGDTVMQGGNSDDYPTTLTNTFKNILKQNIQNHMINEEEKNFSNEMMQMGGYQGQGMNYGATNFNETNAQNASLANMYQQRIGATKDNLSNDFSNLGNATSYLGYTANPYQKTSVKAKYGAILPKAQKGLTSPNKGETHSEWAKRNNIPGGGWNGATLGNKTWNGTSWEGEDDANTTKDDSEYNKYFGENRTSTRGMDYAPMNYNPYNKISKDDVAKLKQVAATPTTGWKLKEFNHKHFGPWGKTNMKFGYKDISNKDFYEDNMKMKDIPGTESNSMQNNNNQSNDQGNDPYADYKYNPYNPASQNPRNTESWFNKMKTVMGDKRNNTPKEDFQGESWFSRYKGMKAGQREDRNRLKRLEEQDRQVGPYVSPEEEMAYGGLTRAQYGVDHKSTNPADGLYDNAGKMLDSEPNSMNPVKMESISALPAFSNSVNEQGLKLKKEQEHLKDPETGSMYTGPDKELDVTTKNRPGFDREAMANWSIAGINTLAGGLEQGQNAKNQKQLSNLQLADNAFMATPANAQSRGDYDPNSGMFRMDQMNPVQFPGGIGYSAYGGAMYQEGGMQEEMQASPQQAQPDPQQIMEGVAAMLQQGAQPEQIAQQLVEMGIPQEQVMQIIQAVMQQMQGGQEQAMQPAMRYGGYAMGGYQDEDSYEDDLDEDEIEELKRQGYNVEYLD